MGSLRPLAALAVALVAPVLAAGAKEGMRAKLDHTIDLATPPGKTVRVAWHLVGSRARTSSSSRIYLRVSRCGHRPIRVRARERAGGYSARFKVPVGGIRKLMVGLEGWQIVGKRRTRADKFVQFDPPLYRRCQ